MSLNPIAKELNDVLDSTVVSPLLSDFGRRIFFPRGIIAQGAEAKKLGTCGNATIGVATKNGSPLILSAVSALAPQLTSGELVSYAPTAGFPEVRQLWEKEIRRKNPLLEGVGMSQPVAVAGLTAGISVVADLFLSPGDTLIAAGPAWDNYSLIAETRRGAVLRTFPMFTETKPYRFNLEGLSAALMEESAKTGIARVILNFPQNPTGYSPTVSEAAAIVAAVKKAADTGAKVLVIADDAYFGLRFEQDIEGQSLFAHFAAAHENILAVKIDGPTKEDFCWGFRLGFVTAASKNLGSDHYDALVKKLMGVVRSAVSCCSTPAQTFLVKAYGDPKVNAEKAAHNALIRARYEATKAYIQSHKAPPALEPLPFNSGYFMSFRTKVSAEKLRQKLLADKHIGAIAIDEVTFRVAFASVEVADIPGILDAVYETAAAM